MKRYFAGLSDKSNTLTVATKKDGKIYYDSEDGHYRAKGNHNRLDDEKLRRSQDVRKKYSELAGDARTTTPLNRDYFLSFLSFIKNENVDNFTIMENLSEYRSHEEEKKENK